MARQWLSSPTAADRHEVELGEWDVDRAGPDHAGIVPVFAINGKRTCGVAALDTAILRTSTT